MTLGSWCPLWSIITELGNIGFHIGMAAVLYSTASVLRHGLANIMTNLSSLLSTCKVIISLS